MAEKTENFVKRWMPLMRPFIPGVEMKFPLAIVRRSLIDMYTADACVVKEKQLQERWNCGTGQRLDCVNMLQLLTFVLIQVINQITSPQPWILTAKKRRQKSQQKQLSWKKKDRFSFEPEAMDFVPPDDEPIDHHSSWKRRAKEDNMNPLRQIIVKAVLNAMNIMEDSGASVKTFEDILDYGKKMLFTSVGDDIDVDILSTLWPRNWSAAQLLLKQEGFCNAKEYYICICRESKEMTRNGKTTTKY